MTSEEGEKDQYQDGDLCFSSTVLPGYQVAMLEWLCVSDSSFQMYLRKIQAQNQVVTTLQ